MNDPRHTPGPAMQDRERVPLHARTDGLNARIEQLDELLKGLATRLEPVLTPSRPRPQEIIPDRTDEGSWLADYLVATSRRLEQTIESARELLERVEL